MSVMRGRRGVCAALLVSGLAMAELALSAAARGATAPTQAEALSELRALLEKTHDEATLRPELQKVALWLGATFSEREAREGRRAFRMTFTEPIPARSLIAAMGWERPYAFSGDAHQSGWSLVLWTGDIDDRYGSRIAIHTPHVGAWAVDPSLDGRPAGERPKVAAGGSPAYDLLREYTAKVTNVAVELWSEGWQVPDRLELPQGDEAPKFALDDALIRGWLEAHKGYGYPQYFDSRDQSSDLRVLAAWNIPTSGVNWTDFWVYCLAETSGWTLLESGYFQPRSDQAHDAVLDVAKDEVRFLGRDGAVHHRVPVAGCKWERP